MFTRRNVLIGVVLLLGLTICTFGQFGPREKFVKGELLVKFSAGAESDEARSANRSVGAIELERLGDLGWQRVRIPAGKTIDEAIREYREREGVLDVQPNYYYRLQLNPNDTQFSSLWGMAKISAPAAWNLQTGSANVVVAVIDTGIRYTHEDLASNIWFNPGETFGNGIDDDGNGYIDDFIGWDFYSNDNLPFDAPVGGVTGHGTHVSGTIGAIGNNGVGVTGLNWNIRLMALKIYGTQGDDTTSAMLINAYNYVRWMKSRGVNIRVTNNSYGGCAEACGFDQATKDAIDALGDLGVLNVFAAGNAGNNNDVTPFYPGSYDSPSILAVAGSNQTDDNVYSYGLNSVDLAAPGFGILSTFNLNDASYASLSGTSMATPHVAGAAALLAAQNPSLSAASLKATLMNTVDMLPQWTSRVKSGGRLNVDRALRQQTVCSFAPPNSTIKLPTKGGTYSVQIGANVNCDFRVKSNSPWITVMSPKVQSGASTVTFRVTVNPVISRTGSITIGDQTLTIRQARNE